MFADQMRQDLRVRGGAKLMPARHQAFLEPLEIFNDAVVNNSNLAALVQVRVGIFIRGLAMSGPTGVADADLAGKRVELEEFGQTLVYFPLLLSDVESLAVEDGHACAVIAAIFQPPQALQNDGGGRLFANITNDSAHNQTRSRIAINAACPASVSQDIRKV